MMEALPTELVESLFEYIPVKELLPCFLLSSRCYRAVSSEIVWQRRCASDFGVYELASSGSQSWRLLYKDMASSLRWNPKTVTPSSRITIEGATITHHATRSYAGIAGKRWFSEGRHTIHFQIENKGGTHWNAFGMGLCDERWDPYQHEYSDPSMQARSDSTYMYWTDGMLYDAKGNPRAGSAWGAGSVSDPKDLLSITFDFDTREVIFHVVKRNSSKTLVMHESVTQLRVCVTFFSDGDSVTLLSKLPSA